MNAVENFASATIVTDPMSDVQVTTVKDHLKNFQDLKWSRVGIEK